MFNKYGLKNSCVRNFYGAPLTNKTVIKIKNKDDASDNIKH